MAEQKQQAAVHGFVGTVAKRALTPIVASAATAVTAYFMRKAAEVFEENVLPKIEETGRGSHAVARDTLGSTAEEAGGDGEGAADDDGREEERRRREQRRKKRRRALEQTSSS